MINVMALMLEVMDIVVVVIMVTTSDYYGDGNIREMVVMIILWLTGHDGDGRYDERKGGRQVWWFDDYVSGDGDYVGAGVGAGDDERKRGRQVWW